MINIVTRVCLASLRLHVLFYLSDVSDNYKHTSVIEKVCPSLADCRRSIAEGGTTKFYCTFQAVHLFAGLTQSSSMVLLPNTYKAM